MERTARLNGPSIAPGATLSILGRTLQAGDTLRVDDSPFGATHFTVKAFGLGRLVLESADGVFELRPWHKGDEPVINLPGPMSAWTISAYKSGRL